MVSLLGPLLLKKTVEEVEPQAEGNHIATSTNGLDIGYNELFKGYRYLITRVSVQ